MQPPSDEEYIEDRMSRFADSGGSVDDAKRILLEAMGDEEQRAFALGVRAGKHWSALEVLHQIRILGLEIAKVIDPFLGRKR